MSESLFFQDLAVMMAAVGLVSVVFTRLGWPKVIGYLLAGILMSEHTWGGSFLADPKSIGTLGQLGIKLFKVVRFAEHLGSCLCRSVLLRLGDDGGGDHVYIRQQRRNDQTNAGKHRNWLYDVFHSLSAPPVKGLGRVSLVMYGVKMFISKIEKLTPSGKLPQKRISIVISPQPTPKTILPSLLGGVEL